MELDILMFKSIHSDIGRPFVALKGSNEKPFAPLQIIEDIEKSNKPDEIGHDEIQCVITTHFLNLLNDGFEHQTIEALIDNATMGFKTAGSDCYDWVVLLNQQRRALNSANTIYEFYSLKNQDKNKIQR